jgi:hypothetical protein
MCKQHLLGEHNEIHKHRPSFEKKHSIAGRYGQIEPKLMKVRHDELAEEMLDRGYKHNSLYEMPDLGYLPKQDREGWVSPIDSLTKLIKRCPSCRRRVVNQILGH